MTKGNLLGPFGIQRLHSKLTHCTEDQEGIFEKEVVHSQGSRTSGTIKV